MEPENEEEEEVKPSLNMQAPRLDADDPEERKAARSMRIAKRLKNLQKQVDKEKAEEEKVEYVDEDTLTIVDKQVTECTTLLEHLLADGEEIVNNIRVASDAREVDKRFKEAEKKEELLKKLEEDANLAQEKFNEISLQWNEILKLNDPLNIDEEMKLQKERCDDLIKQKNDLILDLKKECQRADDIFYKNLQKQLDDVKTMGERVDEQILIMKNAYQSQIALIEKSIEIEQTTTINFNDERWNDLFNQRDREEIEHTNEKLTQIAEFKNKVDKMIAEHREKYRITKMKLEDEIQTLQNEFQNLKANCLINSEKIDYNYQILKRREEENSLIRSQQQRRLNKIQDNINDLKNKIKAITKNGTAEQLKSHKEMQRLQASLIQLQAKADHFATNNEKKYLQVWKMNQKKAEDIIQNINELDKIIHKEVLELEWTPPNIGSMKMSDLPSYRNAMYLDDFTDRKSSGRKNDPNRSQGTDPLTKKILDMVSNSSEFFIEERLWPLFEKHEARSVELCKLDNIFTALKITEAKEIDFFFKFFIKYAFCENCNRKHIDSVKNLDNNLSDDNASTEKSLSRCICGSPWNIAPSDALSAIRDFVARTKVSEEQKVKSSDGSYSNLISRCLTEGDVETFWGRYESAFPPQKIKLWENVTTAMNEYLPSLKDREKLNKDVTSLRKQNSELKNLLRGHNLAEPSKQKYLTPLQKDFKTN